MLKRVPVLTAVLLLLVFITVAVFTGCSGQTKASDEKPSQVNKLTVAIGGEPDEGFDPVVGWGRYGSPLFQSTLLKRDIDLNVVKDLATDWSVSQDGLKWTVKIRDDVKFSDGEKLDAEDIVFTYTTASQSGSVIDLNIMESAEATDKNTIVFTLKEPQSTFINLLISVGIVPSHAYGSDYPENPIGSGPFKLVQWDKGQQLIVEQNPEYYGQKPFFGQLTFLFLDEDAAFAAAKAGEVDIAAIPATFADQEVSGMRLVSMQSIDNRGIMFPYISPGTQTEDGYPIGNNVTSDLALRKAINIAVDRQALVDGVLEGHGTPAYTVCDKMPWWNPETVVTDNDIEGATGIMEAAGWSKNEKGIMEKDGMQASFSLYYPAGDQVRQGLALAVTDMLKPLGIDITVEGKSWDDIQINMYSNAVLFGWGSYDPLEMFNLYSGSTAGQGWYNTGFYSNPAVDEYFKKALLSKTEAEANEFWKKAQWDGTEGFSGNGDSPWVWLVNINHIYLVNEKLDIGQQKIQPHGHGWPVTDTISQWKWK